MMTLLNHILPGQASWYRVEKDTGCAMADSVKPTRASLIRRILFGTKKGSGPLTALIAGGGTGGHLFPGIAIAEALIQQQPGTRIVFASRGNEFEKRVLSTRGFPLLTVDVEGIKGRGKMAKLKALLKIPGAVMQSSRILKSYSPDVVIGMGSYSAGPVALAAWIMGIPVVLHEQNMRAGITNRLLSGMASRIYVSFPGTQGNLDPAKTRLLGNPVRQEISRAAEKTATRPNQPFTVVVLGGSQGAHSVNQAVGEALVHLKEKARYRFIHQTGAADEKQVKAVYERQGLSATVQAFFDDMEPLYRDADLLICRSGATTVAEITSLGKAALFIPYPFAADNHQVLNAKALVDSGAAEMITEDVLSGEGLAQRIQHLEADPDSLREMERKSRGFGCPNAAREIAGDIRALIKGAVLEDAPGKN